MPEVMKTVGRYEILRELGRGGMALVFLARQTDLDRFVALKELGAFHTSDPSFAQRFIRESRVAGSLSHPNIVTVHDYFEHDGTPYIAMEYVERGSLRPYIGTVDFAQKGGILEGLLAGLAAAEQHGIVHRDLKPENLMVTSDGRIKIADFGIAKATTRMQTGAFLTATGTTVGTPTYMAPEQAMAQDVGPFTDMYSVGCMAYEMFTGNVPFHDSDAPMAILLRHVNEPIPPAASVSDTEPEISDWIDRMLVKDPKARTQSAMEAWDEFEEIIIGKLGPRWRRGARLGEVPGEISGPAQPTPKPLTPAPFETAAGGADEFQSFAWGKAAPAPADGKPEEAAAENGAAGAAGAAAAAAAGAAAAGSAPADAPTEEAPTEEAPASEDGGFETYIAPAPARPPTEDSPLTKPAPAGDATPVGAAPAPPKPPAPAPPAPATPAPPAAAGPATPPAKPAPPAAPAPPAPSAGAAAAPPAPAKPATPAPAAATPPAPAAPAKPAQPDPGATVMPEALKKKDPPKAAAAAPPKAPDKGKGKAAAAATPAAPKKGRSPVPFIVAGVLLVAVIGFVAMSMGGGSKKASDTPAPQASAAPAAEGPSSEYGALLDENLGALGSGLESGRAKLAKAKKYNAQGAAALAIAKDYKAAGAALEGAALERPTDQEANAELVAALGAAEAAYRVLGKAGNKSSKTGWNKGRKAVADAENDVAAAVSQLEEAGYDVPAIETGVPIGALIAKKVVKKKPKKKPSSNSGSTTNPTPQSTPDSGNSAPAPAPTSAPAPAPTSAPPTGGNGGGGTGGGGGGGGGETGGGGGGETGSP